MIFFLVGDLRKYLNVALMALCCFLHRSNSNCGTHGSTESNDHRYLEVIVPFQLTQIWTIHNMCKKQQLQSKVSKSYWFNWLWTPTRNMFFCPFCISNANKLVFLSNLPRPGSIFILEEWNWVHQFVFIKLWFIPQVAGFPRARRKGCRNVQEEDLGRQIETS